MKTFLRVFFCGLFLFILLSAFIKATDAQQKDREACPPVSQNDEISYLINGCDVGQDPSLWADHDLDKKYLESGKPGLRIDGTVRTIIVTFKGLEKGTYYLCGRTEEWQCVNSKEEATHKKFEANEQGQIHIKICGGGVDWAKGKQVENEGGEGSGNGKIKEECNPDKDYFHEGQVYRLGVYQDEEGESNVITAEFFVKHSYPIVKLSPSSGNTFGPLTPVKVSLWGKRPGGDNKNNYQVIIEGVNNNYKKERCFSTKERSGETVGIHTQWVNLDNPSDPILEHLFNGTGWGDIVGQGPVGEGVFERGKGGGIGQGSFVLKINERVNDSRPLGIVTESCEGGHSYIYIYFRFDLKAPRGIDIFKVAYDPNNADWEDIYEELLETQYKAPPPPCTPEDPATYVKCVSVDTGLGTIDTTPQGFVKTIFQLVLVIAGFGAVIILIYSGYILMTSEGNKERIAAARETITSAILGLLFIIFSIVILEIIGVDILRIPGFGR